MTVASFDVCGPLPQGTVVLEASAGTGKTQVLTARVLRLLLEGAQPETILCLTFTKAAAAEMAERIGHQLAAWVRLGDGALEAELRAIGADPTPEMLREARALFARVLDCPGGTFQGAGVKTVVLFFDKGAPTRNIWYYRLDPGRSLGKTTPLNDADLAEFVRLQKTRARSEKSWTVDVDDVDAATCDLSVKNPHAPEAAPRRTPQQIIDDMLARDAETAKLLAQVRQML